MKTAVQELIDDLLSGKITDTLANAEYYKEKHKQQIIEATDYGKKYHESFDLTSEQYYQETFNND